MRRTIPTIPLGHSPERGDLDLDGLFLPWECSSFYGAQRRRLLACISGTITMCLVGTVYAWTNFSFLPLTTGMGDVPLRLTHDEYSWSVSLTVLSSMIGSILAAQLADRIGRKYCLIACSTVFTLGWLHMYFASSVQTLYFARGILGIGVGIARTINPMFLSEVADIKLRGRLGVAIAANVHLGSVLAYIPGFALTYTSHLLAIVGISAISILPLIYIRETPYFLVAKGQKEQACKSIAYYKGIEFPDEVRVELRALRAEARYGLHQQSTSDLHSQSRSNLPPSYSSIFPAASSSDLPPPYSSNLPPPSRSDLPPSYRSNSPSRSICETHSDPTREVVGTEATSDLNLPSSSDSHSQSITSAHSKFKCEVRTQATGESRVEYSRDWSRLPSQTPPKSHSQSTSDLHRPTTSQVHRPSTSEIHLEATSEIHPETTSEIHPETTSEMHPETTSEIHPETTSEIHPETTNDIHRSSTSQINRPSTSQINRPSTSKIPPEITREIHPEAKSETQPETTSEIHPETTSEILPETTREIHPETTNEIHRPSTSQIHRPSISQILPEMRMELHPRARSDLRTQFRVDSRASTDISEPYMDLTKYTCLEKLRAILQRSNRKALFIVLGLIMTQHLSGKFTAPQYVEDIISRQAAYILECGTMTSLELLRLAAGYFFAIREDACGRRKLLILSATGTSYISFVLTFYFFSPIRSSIGSATSFIPTIHFIMYQVIFHIGLGALPNVFLCDLFPTKLKGIVGAIVVIFDGIIFFTASKLTQVITDNIGVFQNYLLFWILCLMVLVMLFVWVPETGGKTYREIEELLLGENFNSLNEEISTNETDTRRI